jgi:hypothetical protein
MVCQWQLTVRSWMLPSTILPVSGFMPTWPEQKTKLPMMLAWERNGGGAGAPFVRTVDLDSVILD